MALVNKEGKRVPIETLIRRLENFIKSSDSSKDEVKKAELTISELHKNHEYIAHNLYMQIFPKSKLKYSQDMPSLMQNDETDSLRLPSPDSNRTSVSDDDLDKELRAIELAKNDRFTDKYMFKEKPGKDRDIIIVSWIKGEVKKGGLELFVENFNGGPITKATLNNSGNETENITSG